MRKLIFTIFMILMLIGCAYAENISIRELGERVNWDESSGNPDFILTVRYMKYGTVFCPSFIVHPMGREEDFPKDMETVVLNEKGIWLR